MNKKKIIITSKEELRLLLSEAKNNNNYINNDIELSKELKQQLFCDPPTSGSSKNLNPFMDKEYQQEFEAMSNEDKIQLLKDLWTEGDLPARQLADIGYDALSKIDPVSLSLDDSLYRIVMSDTELEEGVHPVDCLEFNLSGSWTTSGDVAEFFIEHITGGRYGYLWGKKRPQYVYHLTADTLSVDALWEDDSREEFEVVIRGFKPDCKGVQVKNVTP
jgi:hypothetical protein